MPMPTTCNSIFSTLAVAETGVSAVIYWARGVAPLSAELTLLDFDVAPLRAELFGAIKRRMGELVAVCRQRQQMPPHIFTTKPFYEASQVYGAPAAPIDAIANADPAELALRAARFVHANSVRIAAPAHEKARRHPLASALDFRAAAGHVDDPPRSAALWGVVAALDANPVRWARPAA
ncbi:MAG: hypothetical protein ACREE9_00610 [Stellaceae bacterium]